MFPNKSAVQSKINFFQQLNMQSTNAAETVNLSRNLQQDTNDLIGKLNIAVKKASDARNKDCVLLLGKTGVGKSTTINYLLGCHMLSSEINDTDVVIVRGEEIAKIGHSGVKSETLLTEIYDSVQHRLSFCDTGGFMDTRGFTANITASVSTSLVLRAAKYIKLLICIELKELTDTRGSSFVSTLRQATSLLKDYRQHANSMMFLFTKPYSNRGAIVSTEKIRALIIELARTAQGPDAELYQLLAVNGAKNVYSCDPLNTLEKDTLLSAIKQLRAIPTYTNPFQTVYSAETSAQLTELMQNIAVEGCQHYRILAETKDQFVNIDNAERTLLSKKQQFTKKLQRWWEKHIEGIFESMDIPAKLNEFNEKIDSLEDSLELWKTYKNQVLRQINAINNLIQDKHTQLNRLNKDTEELYWSDEVNEAPQFRQEPYESIEMVGATLYRRVHTLWGQVLIPCGPTLIPEKKINIRTVGKEITKSFSYSDLPIKRIEKVINSSGCWSNEVRSDNTYRVTYTSVAGQRASAKVDIYVAHNNLPQTITKVTQLNHELANLKIEYMELNNALQNSNESEKEILRQIEQKTNLLDQLKDYNREWIDICTELDILAAKRASQNDMIELLQQQLFLNLKFDFLKDYLYLSQDQQLSEHPIIKQFLDASNKALISYEFESKLRF